MNERRVHHLFCAVVISIPLIATIFYWGLPSIPKPNDMLVPLFHSFLQAALSAILSIVLGIWGAFGLCNFRHDKALSRMKALLLLPSFAPTLSVLLALVIVVGWFRIFPFGTVGIVLAHGILHGSWLSVVIYDSIRQRLGGQIEMAMVLGSTRGLFLRRVFFQQMREVLTVLAAVVFMMTFTQYTVPSLVGDGSIDSIELWIYHLIRLDGRADQAVGVFLLELLLLASIGAWSLKKYSTKAIPATNLSLLGAKSGITFWLVLVFTIAGALLFRGISGSRVFFGNTFWIDGAFFTFLLSLGVGVFVGLSLHWITFLIPQKRLRLWLFVMQSPPFVLWGLALATLIGRNSMDSSIKVILGLGIIYLPLLYRWFLDEPMSLLKEQINIARTLGASWNLLWRKVTLPQMHGPVKMAASLAALWTSGEFALSGLVSGRDLSLALIGQSLFARYQIDESAAVVVLLLAVGLASVWVIQGVLDVAYQKFTS